MSQQTLPVFVYGLLRPGEAGFIELDLATRATLLGTVSVAGTLYDLGDYPGIALTSDTAVVGELLLPHDAGVLPLLDAYELYDPHDPAGSEYVRVTAAIMGSAAPVWIYVYNRAPNDVPVIAGGDWLNR